MTQNRLHHIGIPGDFLLVSDSETLDFEASQQPFDFPIGQFVAFNSGGRSYAFDGSHMTQLLEALRR